MNRVCILLIGVSLFGVGCSQSTEVPSSPRLPALPEIRLGGPANQSAFTTTSTHIFGSTNMPSILVNGLVHQTPRGTFTIDFPLQIGSNMVVLETSNGFTTSTLRLQLTRETP